MIYNTKKDIAPLGEIYTYANKSHIGQIPLNLEMTITSRDVQQFQMRKK